MYSDTASSYVTISYSTSFRSVIVIEITEAELERLIGSLKIKNSPGYGISNKN
jgi:hypothetical protein